MAETTTRLNQEPIPSSAWLELVQQQVSALRYGHVEITVHEGRVVQVEASVKWRFDRAQK